MKPMLAGFCMAGLAFGQVAEQANRNYQTAAGRESLGRGLTASDRDARQKPRELVAAAGLRPGMTVADIGTGPGYMLPYLSAAVGAGGKVLAEDIFDDFLSQAKASAKNRGLTNVEFVKGSEHNPSLPAGALDMIFALDSYHHYNYPKEMLAAFRKALKPDGRLAIVEYYRRPGSMGSGDPLTHLRLDDAGVIQEVESAGFRLLEERETIPKSQYLVTFRVAVR